MTTSPDPARTPAAQTSTAARVESNLEAADTRSADGASVPFDIRDSNPHSSGDPGLSGDMGVSSERTGPSAADSVDHGITGTEAKGDTSVRTDGAFDTSARQWDAPDVSGADRGSRGQAVGQDDRAEELRYAEGTSAGANGDGAGGTSVTGIDRTVGGEPNSLPLGGDKNHR